MSGAYYNEIDPYAAQWLRNLIAAGHIAAGEVDERSICDVKPEDIRDFTQCHFFAGIGVWSHALRLAQWPDARAVWTGSCPCQPFSLAGKSAGVLDERHLWPHWFWLIEQCRPAVVFGEQVEAAIGHGWLDLVHADLEGLGYAVGRAGIPAAGVGAPHIRQRLWFVADHDGERQPGRAQRHGRSLESEQPAPCGCDVGRRGELGDADSEHEDALAGLCGGASSQCDGGTGVVVHTGVHDGAGWASEAHGDRTIESDRPGAAGLTMGDAQRDRLRVGGRPAADLADESGHWALCDWIPCRDGKSRPVEPGTFPLAHGATQRVGRLRAYGNAIVPQVAAQVIATFMEYRP